MRKDLKEVKEGGRYINGERHSWMNEKLNVMAHSTIREQHGVKT